MTRRLNSLAVDLPYPPSANRMWRHVGRKVLRSAAYEQWRCEAVRLIRQATRGAQFPGAYSMAIHVGRRDNRRRDLDNMVKPIGDVLVLAGAVVDDCDCQRLSAHWSSTQEGVRLVLLETRRVEPLPKPKPSARAQPASEWDDVTFREPGH